MDHCGSNAAAQPCGVPNSIHSEAIERRRQRAAGNWQEADLRSPPTHEYLLPQESEK